MNVKDISDDHMWAHPEHMWTIEFDFRSFLLNLKNKNTQGQNTKNNE